MISPLIGHVFLAKKLDYEVNKVIVISVRLQCERVKSSMLLDLKIINENDEPPIFNEPDGTVIKGKGLKSNFCMPRASSSRLKI